MTPQKSTTQIVQEAKAIHWWIDRQIAKGRTNAEIEAMAPTAIAFINGHLTLAELPRLVEAEKVIA